ncbi:hypothetical protein C8R45DRAFT_1014176 [Mycena sanguinolenta]|nr:hypothetical protein C8R45DRAFT_1014176 [Mycena sanguinolenta]
MRPLFKSRAILSTIWYLPQLSFGSWTPGKAAQIFSYNGTSPCTLENKEVAAWWTSSPVVGNNGNITAAECFLLGEFGDATGINTVAMWEESTTTDSVEPAQANGWCKFWDGLNCTGKDVTSIYAPGAAGGGTCESGRSIDGLLWKTAKCVIGTPPPATSQDPTLPSAPASTSNSASPTSVSTPPQSTTDARRKSISSATIAGVTVGVVALVIVAILLVLRVRRRDRKESPPPLPFLQVPNHLGQEVQPESPTLQVSEKLRVLSRVGTSTGSQSRSPTVTEQSSHPSMVASELRALREEVERLNSVISSGDGNDGRTRAMERELQSYAASEQPEPSLPGYWD